MKRTRLGKALLSSLEEALEFHKGQVTLRSSEVVLPEKPPRPDKRQIARLRSQLRVSQTIFSRMVGVSSATLRSWEQGLKRPSGSACRLLQVIEANPQAFLRTVSPGRPRQLAAR